MKTNIIYLGVKFPEWVNTMAEVIMDIFHNNHLKPVISSITIGAGVIDNKDIIGQHHPDNNAIVVDVENIRDYCSNLGWDHFRIDCQLVLELVRVLGHEIAHACGYDEEMAVGFGKWTVGQFFKAYDIPRDMGTLSEFCGGYLIKPVYCIYAENGRSFYTLRDVVHAVEFHEEIWEPTCKRIDLDVATVSDIKITPRAVANVIAEVLVNGMELPTPTAPPITTGEIYFDEWDVPEYAPSAPEAVEVEPAVITPVKTPPPAPATTATTPPPPPPACTESRLEQVGKVMLAFDSIVLRCQRHLIEKCGWEANGTFSAAGNVVEPIYIGDIAGWDILKSIDGSTADGKIIRNKPVDGSINGIHFKESGFPAYKLHFEVFGNKINRTLTPVNPKGEKKTSVRVANGEKLSWITNDDITQKQVDAIRADGGQASRFKYLITGDKIKCLN